MMSRVPLPVLVEAYCRHCCPAKILSPSLRGSRPAFRKEECRRGAALHDVTVSCASTRVRTHDRYRPFRSTSSDVLELLDSVGERAGDTGLTAVRGSLRLQRPASQCDLSALLLRRIAIAIAPCEELKAGTGSRHGGCEILARVKDLPSFPEPNRLRLRRQMGC